MDLASIKIVGQWRIRLVKVSTYWQRVGRGARDRNLTAVGIIFVESKYLDRVQKEKEEKQAAAAVAAQNRKRKKPPDGNAPRPAKRRPVADVEASANSSAVVPGQQATTPADRDITMTNEGDESVGSTPMLVDEDAQCFKLTEERRTSYHKKPPKPKGKLFKAPVEDEIDFVMSEVVNAEYRGLTCRRVPIKLMFNSDKAGVYYIFVSFLGQLLFVDSAPAAPTVSDHLECDPSSPDGCSRCHIIPSSLCCDLCNPELLNMFNAEVVKPPAPPPRSRVSTKAYEATSRDLAFRKEVLDWRKAKVTERFGLGALLDFGPGAILSMEMLDRITRCARSSKIQSAADLKRETNPWIFADIYGEELFTIVKTSYPVSQPSANPPPTSSLAVLSDSVVGLTAEPIPRPAATATAVTSESAAIPSPGTVPTCQDLPADHIGPPPSALEAGVPIKASRICGACRQPGHMSKSNSSIFYNVISLNGGTLCRDKQEVPAVPTPRDEEHPPEGECPYPYSHCLRYGTTVTDYLCCRSVSSFRP